MPKFNADGTLERFKARLVAKDILNPMGLIILKHLALWLSSI